MRTNREYRYFSLILLLALALLGAACTPAGPGGPPPAEPVTSLPPGGVSEWWLAEVGGEAVEATAVEPPAALRLFPTGEVSDRPEFHARTFCNYLGGTVDLDGAPVFVVEGETDFGCDQAYAAQDAAINAALKETAGLALVNGRLALQDEAGETVLLYDPKPAPDLDPELAGTEWILTELRGAAPLAGARATLNFEGDALGGNTGCNNYGSEIRTVAGGVFETDMGAMNEMDCGEPAGIMAQERDYVKALFEETTTYTLNGDTLTLQDDAGTPLLLFTRKVETASDPTALVGSAWQLVAHNGEPPEVRRSVTLILEADRYWGQSECRVYTGTYAATADDINFPSASMLGEPCADEQLFLPPSGDYRLADGELTLVDSQGESYTYAPLPTADDLPLAGSEWQLLAFVEPGDTPANVQPPAAGVTITARFDGDGRVGGSAGCNEYGSRYEVAGSALTALDPAATEMYCDSPAYLMEQEARYLSWLPAATGYAIQGELLLLEVSEGRTLLFRGDNSE